MRPAGGGWPPASHPSDVNGQLVVLVCGCTLNVDDTPVNLRPEEVVELRGMLEFLCDWLNDRRGAASYRQFTFGLLTVDELRADLARFAFLLGGGGYLLVDTDEP